MLNQSFRLLIFLLPLFEKLLTPLYSLSYSCLSYWVLLIISLSYENYESSKIYHIYHFNEHSPLSCLLLPIFSHFLLLDQNQISKQFDYHLAQFKNIYSMRIL